MGQSDGQQVAVWTGVAVLHCAETTRPHLQKHVGRRNIKHLRHIQHIDTFIAYSFRIDNNWVDRGFNFTLAVKAIGS